MEIEPYRPGLSVAEVKARVEGIDPVIKLGSNEATFRPLPIALAAAAEASEGANRYPDPWCTELRNRLAERHRVRAEQVIPGNGADELIRLLCQVCLEPGSECVYPWPGFPTYGQGALAAGATPVPVGMPPDQLDPDRLLSAVGPRTSLLCLANPNNPTGAHMSKAPLEYLLKNLPLDVTCLLDEAYVEYVDPLLRVDGIRFVAGGRPSLCVLRTFSKAYGLAGFRVGYAVAEPALGDALNRVRTMFNVNEPGQAAAVASLGQERTIKARATLVRQGRRRLGEMLERRGLKPLASQGNFVYAVLGAGAEAAKRLSDALLMGGIIVRPMDGFGAPRALRVTVGSDDQMTALEAALDRLPDSVWLHEGAAR